MSRAIELLIERVAEEEELARKLFAKATGDAAFAEQQLDALNGFRESYTREAHRGRRGRHGQLAACPLQRLHRQA